MNVQVPSTEADLFESGVLDSLGFVDLLARLEQEFGLKISIEQIEVENFRCIEKIAQFVAQQRTAARN
jgi:acyl carrier protein